MITDPKTPLTPTNPPGPREASREEQERLSRANESAMQTDSKRVAERDAGVPDGTLDRLHGYKVGQYAYPAGGRMTVAEAVAAAQEHMARAIQALNRIGQAQDPAQRLASDLPEPSPPIVHPVNPYRVPGAAPSPDPVETPATASPPPQGVETGAEQRERLARESHVDPAKTTPYGTDPVHDTDDVSTPPGVPKRRK